MKIMDRLVSSVDDIAVSIREQHELVERIRRDVQTITEWQSSRGARVAELEAENAKLRAELARINNNSSAC